ncbi:MAG: MFS transporter [Anaerolineales bacterium]
MQNAVSKRTALIVVATGSFLTPFMGSSINIALPSIGKALSMDAITLSWIAMAYSLSSAMFLVPFGRAADIHGRKKVFLAGVVIFGTFSLLCGLATSGTMLIAFRVLQGIGGAMVFGTGIAILTSVFPPQQRGQALGINVAAVYLGLSLGPVFGGLLTQNLGWRSVFFVNVPLCVLIVAFTTAYLKGEWAECAGEPFDWAGSAIYGVGLASLVYGFSRLPAGLGAVLVAAGLAGIAAFALWESRTAHPVLDVTLFRHNRVFALSSLAALINYAATAAIGFLLSLYLQYIKALTPQQAGFVLIAQPAMQALFSPLAGRLSDRIEPRIVASTGMTLNVIGIFLLTLLNATTPLPFIIASLLFLGLGFALFSSPNTNAIMGSVERRFYGVASATQGTMRIVGQMLSMGIVMLIINLILGPVQITPEYHPLFLRAAHAAFVTFAILCFGGIFASLARGKVR